MDTATANTGFDTREFRTALGQFATGVTIVTATGADGTHVGTTASSFNSVSVDPPLILWSIDNGARSLATYEEAEHFVVNILAADQVTLSNHFARQQEDKFADISFDVNGQGVPVLQNCSAYFHCQTRYLYEGGDHTIIVGEVLQFESRERDGLLFHQGRYSVSDAHPATVKPEQQTADENLPQSFAVNYLHYLAGRCFTQLMGHLEKMLEGRDINQNEFRILASFSGLDSANLDTLGLYTILQADELMPALNGLIARGLVSGDGESYQLSDAGQEVLMPLMAVAKSNEADMLGAFSWDEAQQFKTFLKRAIDWTA